MIGRKMAKWNRIRSGFDAEEETVNFGTRNFVENNGSIYETWTLATIEPEDESAVEDPNVAATICNTRPCVVVDTWLTIFKDQTFEDVSLSVGFDTPITSYCLSSDGAYLCVAVADAILHCFMLLDGGQKLFTIDFEKEYKCSQIVKVYIREIDHIEVIVITSIGNIYRIDVTNRTSIQDEKSDSCQILKNVDLVSRNSPVEYVLEVNFDASLTETCCSNEMTLITVGEDLSILPDGISCHLKDLPYKYTKMQMFNDFKAIICLRSDGCLTIICIRTLLETKIWDGPVKDFMTINEKTHDSYQMLVLMAPKNNETSTLLHLTSFPDFNIIYTMTVSSSTYLVDVINGTVDRLLYLEGKRTLEGKLEAVRMKSIVEGIPELRLNRLLRQRRFDEARTFANKFNLDIESVYRVEASMFMNCLHPMVDNEENIDFDSFKCILDKINDVEFIHQCCNNTLTRNYKDTRNLFEYVRKRIIEFINGHQDIDKNYFFSLLQDLNDTLRKHETFELIQKTTIDEQAKEKSNINKWFKFRKVDLLDECIERLSLGELDAAALIWTRHTSSFARRVTKGTVTEILRVIPGNLQPCKLWPWLYHFVPSVTSFLPGALSEIIQWGCKKARTLETFHRSIWPDIGLEFVNGLIDLLHFDGYNICFQFHEQYTNKNSQFHQLTTLAQAMSDLLELKSRYNLILPLNSYLSNPVDVTNLLLSKVHIDCLANLMENFLQQYMLNNSLQNDKTLSSFIQNTLNNSKEWWLWEKAPWDKRLTIVIGYIQNIQNRLQQTLQVLKIAPVPWSECLVQLAEQSFVYEHPLVSQIRFERNNVAEKLILKKYGFAHTRQCPNLFRSIVKQNRTSMVNDIFELTKTDHALRMTVLYFCLSYHLKHYNIESVTNVLQQLSDDIAVKCCEQLVCVTKSRLNSLMHRDENLEHHVIAEILNSVEERLRESCARNSQYSTKYKMFLNDISSMQSLYRLKNELNISITLNAYIKDKQNVMIDYVKGLVDNQRSLKITPYTMYKDVVRANDLLHLPQFFGLYRLLRTCPDAFILMAHVAKYLSQYNLSIEDSKYARAICALFVYSSENFSTVPAHLQNLCSSLLLCADDRYLPGSLYLSRCADAYSEAIGSRSRREVLPREFYPIYEDISSSSGLSSSTLLPLLQRGLTICSEYRYRSNGDNLPSSYNEEQAVETMCESVKDVQDEHHDYALLKIFMAIYIELCSFLPHSERTVKRMQLTLNYCARSMLKKVIQCKVFDLQLGLVCLFLLPEVESLDFLTSIAKFSRSDHARDRVIKDLAFEYCRLTKRSDVMEKLKWQRILHYWAQRLRDYGIAYKDTLNSDTNKKRAILDCVMKKNKSGTIELLRDLCLSFGFNLDDCYLLYLQSLLSSWQPKCEFISNDEREPKVNQDDVQELTATCRKVAAQISDKVRMKLALIQMFPRINFYHYEVFLILLELSDEKKIEMKCHLCFLQNYTRVGLPTDIEREEWGKFSQENESLPSISKYRMPFLPKVEQYKIITPELNLKTYEKWLTIGAILKIPAHNICTLAVRGAVTDAWKNEDGKNKTKWSVNMRNSQLLKDIKKCIGHISGEDRFYYGTAALYYVVNHTPPGADLVAAAKECYLYSQQWQHESPKSFSLLNDKMTKINEKYTKYTCMHILYTQGLGEQKYLNLVEDPEKLVRELYADETIPNRYKRVVGNRPDVNLAVNTLGSVFSLNLIKIRFELLDVWLQPSENWNDEMNDSITRNFSQGFSTSTTLNAFEMDDNLLRACYIVDSGDTELFVNYLIDISFPEDGQDCFKPGVRFRALRVLQSITNEETLQDYVKRDIQTLNHHMRTLQYLDELEKLELPYSVESFERCSKQKLVQLLIDRGDYTSRALELIPQLYIDYKIDDFKYLQTALDCMTKLSLVKELKKTLLILGSIDYIVNSSGYINAWQIVVSDAFNKLHAQSTPETVDNCIEILRLLHACPIIDKLDFNTVINCCMLAKQWHLAGALLPFMTNSENIRLIIQELGRADVSNEITSKLMELEVKGILVVRQAMMMLEQARVITHTTQMD